jgi:hypothetical protein
MVGRNEQRARDVVAEIEDGGGTATFRLDNPNCTRNCTRSATYPKAKRPMVISVNALVGRRRASFAGSELHPNAPGTPIGPPRIDGRSAL